MAALRVVPARVDEGTMAEDPCVEAVGIAFVMTTSTGRAVSQRMFHPRTWASTSAPGIQAVDASV